MAAPIFQISVRTRRSPRVRHRTDSTCGELRETELKSFATEDVRGAVRAAMRLNGPELGVPV